MYIVIYYLGVFNSTYFSIKNSFCFFQLIQKNSSDHSSSFFFLQKMKEREGEVSTPWTLITMSV